MVTLLDPGAPRTEADGGSSGARPSSVSFLIASVISGLLVGAAGMLYVLLVALWSTSALAIVRPGGAVADPEDVPRGSGWSGAGGGRGSARRGRAELVGMPGLIALIAFTSINDVLGRSCSWPDGARTGLSRSSRWRSGACCGACSAPSMIIGGLVVSRRGLGRNPVRRCSWPIWSSGRSSAALHDAHRRSCCWRPDGGVRVSCPSPRRPSRPVLQKVVPFEWPGRVFGFARSVEQAALAADRVPGRAGRPVRDDPVHDHRGRVDALGP